jgi:hypothetical protein
MQSISGMTERTISHSGESTIRNHTNGACITILFRESGFFGPMITDVTTVSLHDNSGVKIPGGIEGTWDGTLKIDDEVVWKAKENNDGFFGFGEFAMSLNELSYDLADVIPKSDSRLRKDMRVYELGDVELAGLCVSVLCLVDELKLKLEARQRETMKKACEFVPRWFLLRDGEFGIKGIGKEGEWVFTGEYWHARAKGFVRVYGKVPDLS